MNDNYELAKELFNMAGAAWSEEDKGAAYYDGLIDRAIRVICPDFYERYSKELDEELEKMDV